MSCSLGRCQTCDTNAQVDRVSAIRPQKRTDRIKDRSSFIQQTAWPRLTAGTGHRPETANSGSDGQGAHAPEPRCLR